ncbi:MAG: ATP-binding cassette domain-containing protein [Bacteroidales bacterium]
MIQVELSGTGKKFQGKWVFRGIELQIGPEERQVIAGKNGSGKSTLLQMIAGFRTPSEGNIAWFLENRPLQPDLIYRYVAMAAPGLEPTEEFTFPELIAFHQRFKPFPGNPDIDHILEIAGLTASRNKAIKYFSSGMRQRVKLVTALMPLSGLVLLDEPCTNLDRDSRKWYKDLLEQYGRGKTIVIASNHNPEEYEPDDPVTELSA